MLICHCNLITDKEIEDQIIEFLDEDCWQLIVPAKVYHAMEKRGRCFGCFPNVVDIIIKVTEDYHRDRGPADENVVNFLDRVRGLREQYGRLPHERRTKSNRAA